MAATKSKEGDRSFPLLFFYIVFFMNLYTLAQSEDDCTNGNLTCSNNDCSECRHHVHSTHPQLTNCPLFFVFCFFLSLAILVQTVQYAYIGQTVDVTATAPSYCKLVNILCYVGSCVNHDTTWLPGSGEGELVLQCHVRVKEGVPRVMFHGLGLYSGEVCSEPAFLHPIGI